MPPEERYFYQVIQLKIFFGRILEVLKPLLIVFGVSLKETPSIS